MRVQILLDGTVLSTQDVYVAKGDDDPTIEGRRAALRQAVGEGTVALNEILRVTFRVDEGVVQERTTRMSGSG